VPALIVLGLLAVGVTLVHPWAGLVAVAAAGLFIAAWFGTRKLYLALLVIAPFSVELAVGGGTKVDIPIEVLIPVLVLAVVLRAVLRGRVRVLRSPLWIPVLGFAAYFPLTYFGAGYPLSVIKSTLRDWTHIAGGFALALVLLRGRKDTESLLHRAVISTGLLAAYGILTQLAQGVAIYQTIGWPFFQEHTIPAAIMSLLALLALGLVMSGYARSSWVRFVYLPLLVLAMAISFVRGAWIAFVAGALVLLWIYRKRVPLNVVAVSGLVVILLMVSIGALDLGGLFVERMEQFADPGYVAHVDRLDRWGSAITIWRDHPVFGTGWGTFGDEYFDYVFLRRAYSTGQRMGAHNLYLEIMADGGLVALALFLAVIAVFYREAFRVLRKVRGDPLPEGLCAGTLAAGSAHFLHLTVNNLGPSAKMALLFWFILALVPLSEHLWENRPRSHG
jgi:O-antigen ligase